ncbi:hypothetical protein Q0Z83_055550 [Actinoplanes sichuanensis]|nr:hypothetical protein Q0Z83_055550 [Actinoplanes sichuanensis]
MPPNDRRNRRRRPITDHTFPQHRAQHSRSDVESIEHRRDLRCRAGHPSQQMHGAELVPGSSPSDGENCGKPIVSGERDSHAEKAMDGSRPTLLSTSQSHLYQR